MRYMIVDDNARMRTTVRMLVAKAGDSVLECADGEEALKQYDAFSPDVVLLDVEMKGMDGFEVLRKLRERDPDARVLIVTNYDSPLYRKRARKEGAVAFVSKERLMDLETVIKSLGHG